MIEFIRLEPIWLQTWILFMVVVNSMAVFFVRRVEARWVLLAWVLNAVLMNWLFTRFGYVRILGASHVLLWTPLVIYLYARRRQIAGAGRVFGTWGAILAITNATSLALDYVDLVRYFLGDRS